MLTAKILNLKTTRVHNIKINANFELVTILIACATSQKGTVIVNYCRYISNISHPMFKFMLHPLKRRVVLRIRYRIYSTSKVSLTISYF